MLGAGRVINTELLKKLEYFIYDPILIKWLDNYFNYYINKLDNINENMINIKLENEVPPVLLYKGDWECINGVDKLIFNKSYYASLNTHLIENVEVSGFKEIYPNLIQNDNQI